MSSHIAANLIAAVTSRILIIGPYAQSSDVDQMKCFHIVDNDNHRRRKGSKLRGLPCLCSDPVPHPDIVRVPARGLDSPMPHKFMFLLRIPHQIVRRPLLACRAGGISRQS